MTLLSPLLLTSLNKRSKRPETSGAVHIAAQIDEPAASFRLQMAHSAQLSRIFYEESEMSRAFHNLAQLDKLAASFRLQMALSAPWRTREKARNESRVPYLHSSRQTYSPSCAASYSFVDNLSHALGENKQKNRNASHAPHLRLIAHI